MEFYDVVANRFSVRSFSDRPVESQKLERILDAARRAPSAKNLQECRYIVVTDPKKRELLAQASFNQKFVAEAPVVIVCCSDTDRSEMRCGHPRFTIDSGIAIEHLALAATAEGLGSCWIGSFDPAEVRKILSIPEAIEVMELLPIGYPAPDSKPVRGRLPLEQIVCYESWEL